MSLWLVDGAAVRPVREREEKVAGSLVWLRKTENTQRGEKGRGLRWLVEADGDGWRS